MRWRISPPHGVSHLEKILLSEPDEPADSALVASDARRKLLACRAALKARIRREGYTRPATLYIEGLVSGG